MIVNFHKTHKILCLLLGSILIISSCTNSKAYKISEELYNQGDYQKSLGFIEQALNEDPQNEQYLKHKQDIIDALNRKDFYKVLDEYKLIPSNDLDNRAAKIPEIINAADKCGLEKGVKAWKENLAEIITEKEYFVNASLKMEKAFEENKYEEALTELMVIKPYIPYMSEIADVYKSTLNKYHLVLEAFIEKEYERRNFERLKKVSQMIGQVYASDDIFKTYSSKVGSFYREKAETFLNNNKKATAVLYYYLANEYQPNSVEASQFDLILNQLKEYKEKIYIEIRGSIEKGKKERYCGLISEDIYKKYTPFFERGKSTSDSDIAIMISVVRLENNIETSKPQIKYSKYITGYRKEPNSRFFEANAAAEQAGAILNNPSNYKSYNNFSATLNSALLITAQTVYDRNIAIMNSPSAFDDVPITADYSYSQTDITINNLVQFSYKILELSLATYIIQL